MLIDCRHPHYLPHSSRLLRPALPRRRYRHLQRLQVARGERVFFGSDSAGGVQLGLQVVGVVAVAGYSALMTFLLLFLIDKAMGLRVHVSAEIEGLDVSVHGEKIHGDAYGHAAGERHAMEVVFSPDDGGGATGPVSAVSQAHVVEGLPSAAAAAAGGGHAAGEAPPTFAGLAHVQGPKDVGV